VYQKFGVEPERRPPTPLLPLALSDCGDELADDYKASPTAFQEANTGTGIHQLPHNGYIGLRGGADIASPAIQGAYQNTLPLQLRSALLVVKQGAAEVNGFVHEKALPRRDLFQDRDNLTRQRLYGRLEGMLIGAHLARNVSLKEAYSLVNVQYPDDIVELLAWDEKVRANRAAGKFLMP
jgi:hypothetical protein